MTADLHELAEVVRRETGIALQASQLTALEAAVSRLEPDMDPAAFLRERRRRSDLLGRLIDEVTIKETFFFRQSAELEAIDWRALLDAAEAAGSATVRVWVAACASGEEAYTLAILASESFGSPEPPISIMATDISEAALDRAREGRYRGRTVRGLSPELRDRHFVADDRGIVVGDRLRRLVDFRRHNLVHDPAPADQQFELIACRNVLIYFDGETVEKVIGSLEGALAPAGMLILGAADRLCGSARTLERLKAPPRAPRPPASQPGRVLRRPLGRAAAGPMAATLPEALAAADEGRLEVAVEITTRMLTANALDADAYFVRGLAELGLGELNAAVESLRRALYVDPSFGLAAFKLGRAQEQSGDSAAAVRAYQHALGTLEPDDLRHEAILDQVDLGDVATACGLRLSALRGGTA